MEKQLINVTLLLVKEDIEPILAEQPTTVQSRFRSLDLYDELTAYVLSRIPNSHVVVPRAKAANVRQHLVQESAERQLRRERFIREGIYWVLEKGMATPRDRQNASAQLSDTSIRTPVTSGRPITSNRGVKSTY
ncbi:MAG: hypothetical protein F6J87_04540 [Spirulina sp. SIO3F2]|nr:hypothetical protein [Spirulina sp. SIO3F2]